LEVIWSRSFLLSLSLSLSPFSLYGEPGLIFVMGGKKKKKRMESEEKREKKQKEEDHSSQLEDPTPL